MALHVALLRGINLGPSHRVAMADLRALFTEAGCSGVGTWIQSGNVVFDHPDPEAAAAVVEAEAPARFGFPIPVVLRSAPEWARLVADDPFPGVPATAHHVTFLRLAPSPGELAGLDPAAVAPEEIVVKGRDLHLHLPNGMAAALLPAALSRVAPGGTTRNWRTILKVAELLGQSGDRAGG